MQNLRRALALRLPHNDISIFTSTFSKQQAAAMSKITKTESGSGDSKLQLMMKALEPQAADDVTMTPEELAEAEKRSDKGPFILQLQTKSILFLDSPSVEHIISNINSYNINCRAKEYSRLKMQQHRQWQIDLTTKLKLKQAAIAALPPDLQVAALVPDETPFPSNRQIWTDTPPVEEVEKGPAQTQRTGRRTLGTKKR
jgi:ribosomal protein S10